MDQIADWRQGKPRVKQNKVSRPEKGQKVSLVGAEERLFLLFVDLILFSLFISRTLSRLLTSPEYSFSTTLEINNGLTLRFIFDMPRITLKAGGIQVIFL